MTDAATRRTRTKAAADKPEVVKPEPPSESVVLAGYQAAIELWTYEGNLIWTKYNAMLVANSLLLAMLGFTIGSSEVPDYLPMFMSVGGLLLCFIWVLMTRRGFDYYSYWILSARELEEKFIHPAVQTVSRGGSFASGETVTFTIDGRDRTLQLSKQASMLRTAVGGYLTIGVFIVLYLVLLVAPNTSVHGALVRLGK